MLTHRNTEQTDKIKYLEKILENVNKDLQTLKILLEERAQEVSLKLFTVIKLITFLIWMFTASLHECWKYQTAPGKLGSTKSAR